MLRVVEAERHRAGRHAALAERLPAHPDGVDLVDEDDALTAPLARELLRAPGEDPHDDRVDPDERRGEAGARDRDEGRVEAGRERLRQHGLAGAGRTEKEHAALALAAVLLELLAGLPDRDDAAHLFLRLDLPANVVELDAPLRVTRLEGLDLREVHQEQRAEQDHEVEDQEDRQHDQERQDLDEDRGVEEPPAEEGDDPAEDADLEPEPPEPRAPAGDDVLLAQLCAVDTEEARPRNRAMEDEIDDPARRDHERERAEERRPPRPAALLCEPHEDRNRGDERDDRRGTRQPPPAEREILRLFPLHEPCERCVRSRHRQSVRRAFTDQLLAPG